MLPWDIENYQQHYFYSCSHGGVENGQIIAFGTTFYHILYPREPQMQFSIDYILIYPLNVFQYRQYISETAWIHTPVYFCILSNALKNDPPSSLYAIIGSHSQVSIFQLYHLLCPPAHVRSEEEKQGTKLAILAVLLSFST